jgi:hypothetical protein
MAPLPPDVPRTTSTSARRAVDDEANQGGGYAARMVSIGGEATAVPAGIAWMAMSPQSAGAI